MGQRGALAARVGSGEHGPMAEERFTRADLDGMPEDGKHYELLDGVIIATPAPGARHQLVASHLYRKMFHYAESAGLLLLSGPFEVVLGQSVVLPDLMAAPRASYRQRELPEVPLLLAEVFSPATARIDALIKRDLYARAGVAWYWMVDPEVPSVTILRLGADGFEVARSGQGQELVEISEPWPVHLTPAELLD
jgi:Uma2 family endonuclease